MKKVPKKLRKALRNLPKTKKIIGHRHVIAKAFDRYSPTVFHYGIYRPYDGRW